VAPITEAEWFAHRQSTEMLGLLRDRACENDLRRFAIACCRRIWRHIHDDRSRRAVEMAELDINGRLAAEERLAVARGAAQALAEASAELDIRSNGHLYHAAWAAALCLHTDGVPLRTRVDDPSIPGAFDCAMYVAVNCAYAAAIHRVHPIHSKAQKHAQLAVETDAEYAEQCHLVRAIFGYPFAP
jgi:PAS domain-containing protein